MLSFLFGIVTGCILTAVFLFAGKETAERQFFTKKESSQEPAKPAQIIKMEDPIAKVLKNE